jgi:hypothetical protein
MFILIMWAIIATCQYVNLRNLARERCRSIAFRANCSQETRQAQLNTINQASDKECLVLLETLARAEGIATNQ